MSNIPKLRFPEFTDAWEKCKLGDVAERVTRKNKNLESDLPLTISAQDGLISQNEFFNKQIASRDISGYYLLQKGEFAYNKSYSNGYPWGAIKRLEKYENGVVSTLYICFALNEKANSDFISTYYDTNIWHSEVSQISAEGARNHGLLNIAANDFFKTLISLPTLPEQQKIGTLFRRLDRLITLHKRKWDDVILLKKALLQKMFPKNGSDFPALRFPEFTDAWEKCKLESLGKILTGNTPKTKEKENWTIEGEGYIWITPTDIDGLLTSKSARSLTETGWKKSRQLPPNSVLITSIASIGKNTINTVPAAFNQQINAIIPENNDAYFILSAMVNCEQDFAELAGQTAVPIINKTTFSEFEIFTPTLPEQQKIGALFRRLDRLITLHKRQHEHYQLLKKALLQQMFV